MIPCSLPQVFLLVWSMVNRNHPIYGLEKVPVCEQKIVPGFESLLFFLDWRCCLVLDWGIYLVMDWRGGIFQNKKVILVLNRRVCLVLHKVLPSFGLEYLLTLEL